MPALRFPLGNPFGTARGGGPMLGAGPPSLNEGVLNQILAPYGVQEPQQFIQPGPFENQPSFAGHPGIAGRLDNALIAAALTPEAPLVEGAGGGISRAIQGVLGVPGYRRQFAAEQALMPLQVAQMVGGLQGQQAMLGYYKDIGEYYRSRGQSSVETAEAAQMRASNAANAAIIRQNMLGATKPRLGANGKVQEPFIDPHDPDYQVQWRDTDLDPEDFKRSELHGRVSSAFGGGLPGAIMATQLEAKYGSKLPELLATPTPAFAQDVSGLYGAIQRQSAGFQGNQQRLNTVPVSEQFGDMDKRNAAWLKGTQYGIAEKDAPGWVKRQAENLQRQYWNSGAAPQNGQFPDFTGQAQLQLNHMRQHDAQLQEAFDDYQRQSLEVRSTIPAADWIAQSRGYNAGTRTFAQPQQQQPGQVPPPVAGQPAPQLSPGIQGIMNLLKP